MFKHNNLTDYEKLLFAKSHIDELKLDNKQLALKNGELQSQIDELKHVLKNENPSADKLLKYKEQILHLKTKCKRFKTLYEKTNQELILIKLYKK